MIVPAGRKIKCGVVQILNLRMCEDGFERLKRGSYVRRRLPFDYAWQALQGRVICGTGIQCTLMPVESNAI